MSCHLVLTEITSQIEIVAVSSGTQYVMLWL